MDINYTEFVRSIVSVFPCGVWVYDAMTRSVLIKSIHTLHLDPVGRPNHKVLLIAIGEIQLNVISLQNGKASLLLDAIEAKLRGIEIDCGWHIQR